LFILALLTGSPNFPYVNYRLSRCLLRAWGAARVAIPSRARRPSAAEVLEGRRTMAKKSKKDKKKDKKSSKKK